MLHAEAPHEMIHMTSFAKTLLMAVVVSVIASIFFNVAWLFIEPHAKKMIGTKSKDEHNTPSV